jgi:acetyltransferase
LKVDRAAAELIVKRFEGKDVYLPQVDAFELLKAYGVPVPRVASVTGKSELAAAAKQVGFPCVLKVDSAEVVHKSDEGGVKLNITTEDALGTAFEEMVTRFSGKKASYLLMEQKPIGRELIIGATASPGLGSLVMFGLGGIFVEAMKDVAVAVAPLSRPEAREMVQEIKGYPILEGIPNRRRLSDRPLRGHVVGAAPNGASRLWDLGLPACWPDEGFPPSPRQPCWRASP